MKQARAHLLDTEPFGDAFGPKRKRKRPKLLAVDYESLIKKADGSQGKLLLLFLLADVRLKNEKSQSHKFSSSSDYIISSFSLT